METITSWIEAVVGWFEIIPIRVWSIVIGLMVSLLLTQFVKSVFPIGLWCKVRQGETVYRTVLRSFAFFVAFAATFATWPSDDAFRIYVALGVGLATPVFYKVATSVAYRVWSNLEDRLSGDP